MRDWLRDAESLLKQYNRLINPGGQHSPADSSGKTISRGMVSVTSLRVTPKQPVPTLSFEISLYGLREYLASLECTLAQEADAQAHLATLKLRLDDLGSSLNWPQVLWLNGLVPLSRTGE